MTTYMGMAVHMALADNALVVNDIVLYFPKGCLGSDLGLNYVSS